jgi:hypothetical protein
VQKAKCKSKREKARREIFDKIKIDLTEYADKSDEEVDALWDAFKVKLGEERYNLGIPFLGCQQSPHKKRRKEENKNAGELTRNLLLATEAAEVGRTSERGLCPLNPRFANLGLLSCTSTPRLPLP